MKHAFAIIVAILFVSVELLSATNVGQYWDLIEWFDFIPPFVRFCMLTGAGLLLGLFTYRKRRYGQRIARTVPLTFAFYCAYQTVNMGIFHFGLDGPYNYFSAKRDLKSGKAQLLYAGQGVYFSDEHHVATDSLRRAYGFESYTIGIWEPGADRYNAVVIDHLKSRNGVDWENQFQAKLSVLRRRFSDE